MTDFDPDAYLHGADSSASFDPDAYLSQPASPSSVRSIDATPEAPSLSEGVRHAQRVGQIVREHPFSLGVGMGENALSAVTGGVGSLADALTLSEPGTHDWAYRPRTEAGKELAAAGEEESKAISQGFSGWAAQGPLGNGPLVETIKRYGPEALGAVGTVTGAAGLARGLTGPTLPVSPPVTAQDVVNRSASASPQSQGAASAAPRMTNVSPELQQAVVDAARQTGGAVNPEVLNRHIEADSLPLKIQLTPGQASQNPGMISAEMNNRGRIAGLPEMLNEQNKRLTQNIQAIRDRVGPDVFSANHVEHGDTLIQAYKDKAAVADADINQKYQALRDAAGGDFPVSAPTLLKNATSALNKELLLDHAPKSIMSTLGRLADDDNMTYQNFESLRTNLARIARSSTDGNERAAAGVIRSAMEELPLKPGAAELKPLADSARSAARAQFQALDADPAYKAAVNESVPPDRFVQRYVIGAPRDQVALMRENLKDNPTATQTMGVAALDHLRQSSGIDPMGNGTFSQAGFNKHLQALSPKLGSLLDPQTIDQLETLGNVARYTQAQPKGSFVNNSNTLVGALASHAANVAESGANVAAKGFPIGTIARKVIQGRADTKAAKQILKPYGGLTDLPEKP